MAHYSLSFNNEFIYIINLPYNLKITINIDIDNFKGSTSKRLSIENIIKFNKLNNIRVSKMVSNYKEILRIQYLNELKILKNKYRIKD